MQKQTLADAGKHADVIKFFINYTKTKKMLTDKIKLCLKKWDNCIGFIDADVSCFIEEQLTPWEGATWLSVDQYGNICIKNLPCNGFKIRQNPDWTCTPLFTQWSKETEIDNLDKFIRKIIDWSETKVVAGTKPGQTTNSIKVTGTGTIDDPYKLYGYKVVCTVDQNDENNVIITITNPECDEKTLCMTKVYALNNQYGYFAQCGWSDKRVNIKFEIVQDTDPAKPCHLVLIDWFGNKSTPLDLLSMLKWCILNGVGNQAQITDTDFKRAVTNCINNNLNNLFNIEVSDTWAWTVTFNGVVVDTFNIVNGALSARNSAITSPVNNTTKTNLKNYILDCLNSWLPNGLNLFTLWGVQFQSWANYPTSFQLNGSQLELTINGITVASQDISAFLVDINVSGFQITNPSAGIYNLVITETDGTTHTAPLGSTFCSYINSLSLVNPLLTDTIVGSRWWSCIKFSVNGLSALVIWQLTNAVIGSLQNNDSFVDNGDGTYTHTSTSGSSVTINTNINVVQLQDIICNLTSQTPTLTSTLPMCNGGTMWSTTVWDILALIDNREVQVYPDLAWFPTTGEDNIIYKAEDTDLLYIRDTTTNAYVVYSWPNKSVLWDEVWSVPTVINVNTPIEENPDRTVQKIETDWSKILIPFDPFYVDWSDQVFAKPTDVFIPSNANTDEFMMIDTATGQLKISTERIKEIWSWIFSNLPTSSVSFNTSWFDYYEKQQNLLTVSWLTAIPWRKWTFVWFIETTFASAWNEFSNSLHSLVFCTKNSGIALNWLWILWRSSQTSYTLLWSQNIQWLATNSAIYIDNVQNWDVLWWLLRILVDDWWTQTNSANWVNYYTEVVGHFISLKL